MKCKNCGQNEANFRYTKIINGEKQELILCDECAKKLGLENFDLDFNMPIGFSNFLGDFWNDNEELLLNAFPTQKQSKCTTCGMTFDEFLNKGKFGCGNCYSTFENKLDEVIKQIHGAKKHIGKKVRRLENAKEQIVQKHQEKETEKVIDERQEKINALKKQLKEAVNTENYEEAAKLRDEIKLLEGNK